MSSSRFAVVEVVFAVLFHGILKRKLLALSRRSAAELVFGTDNNESPTTCTCYCCQRTGNVPSMLKKIDSKHVFSFTVILSFRS
jgi:hypothetical protein